ncbi:prolyl aminopeptidase [Phyllobacterium sp. LjRoot231]|uniref:prolyl aminopeptidase n=1 Tax=Phyllobacterium sp. LjRoot231 TaxID=3342289 RepID=UPI003ECE7D1A
MDSKISTVAPANTVRSCRLQVDDLHNLYIEEHGNPDGLPVIFLHGGPGAGLNAKYAATFDTDVFRIILFDQRGAGKSTPHASIERNTTQDLVADIEAIRILLKIDAWLVAGGSWGSCLALAYGQSFPQRCLGFRLHGIFLAEPQEIEWWFQGSRMIFPDYWDEFAAPVASERRQALLPAYYEWLTCGDSKTETEAALRLRTFSASTQTFRPDPDHIRSLAEPQAALAIARLFAHYCMNGAFMQSGQLISGIDRIRHLPCEIVQGRYDTVTPMSTAWRLRTAWPEAEFTIVVEANHQSTVEPMVTALRQASDRLVNTLRGRGSMTSAMLNRLEPSPSVPSIARFFDIPSSKSPVLSFDGTSLAYLSDEGGFSQIWIKSLENGSARQLTRMTEPVGMLAFSPTSHDLLFTADCGGDERHQLWILPEKIDAPPFALTTDPTVVNVWGCWSPDGQRIAYGSNARDRCHIDLYVMDMATRTPRMVLQAKRYREPLAFLPDGEHLLVRDASRSMSDQDLCLLNLATGLYKPLLPHEGYARYLAPKMAEDGFFLITDQDSEFLGVAFYSIVEAMLTWCIRLEGQDIQAIALSPDKTKLACVVNTDGWSNIRIRDLATLEETLLQGYPAGVIDTVAWSKDGASLVFSLEGAATPPDIWRYDFAAQTFANLTCRKGFDIDVSNFAEPVAERVVSFDGVVVPFFVYRPAGPAPTAGYPAVIIVHGGPEMQWTPTFRADVQFMLAQGIMVIAPNVRGSTGYGSTFCHLDDRELRLDSVADLKAVRLWLRECGEVNDSRVGVFGRSYGGFMVLSAMTEYPDLWKCGIEFYGIANFKTLLQTTGPWRSYLRAAEYGDVETMSDQLDRFSPINRIANISAPLMIVQGMDDPRVPPGESEMVYSCLRGLGRPVTYLRIPHAGHGFSRIEHKHEVFTALADFIEQHL